MSTAHPIDIQHIFADERPFAQSHASTVIQLTTGTFLAAWFGGSKEGNADVGIWGADCRQGQWSTPRLLAKMREHAHWNPVLHVDERDRVYLFFKLSLIHI